MLFLILFLYFNSYIDLCEKLKGFKEIQEHLNPTEAEKILDKIIEEGIYNLRGPKPDGSFEYAILSKENPEYINYSIDLEKLPFEWKMVEENIFSLKIYVPKKKNLFWEMKMLILKKP